MLSASQVDNDDLRAFLNAAIPPRLVYPSSQPVIYARVYQGPNCHPHQEIFNRVFTPYNPDAFRFFLDKHNLTSSYPLLVENLRDGFPLGPMPPLSDTDIINNYPSMEKHLPLIEEDLAKEVEAGRMHGPFSKDIVEHILGGPFRSSPLVVKFQPTKPGEPDKVRVCRHLSRQTNSIDSVNSFIKKADWPTRFDTVSRVADVIALAPAGTQACVMDIAKFHRTCPVLPEHKCWLVVQGRRDDFYIDHVHPFGTASASSNAGMIANAMVDIWMAEGVRPILKYEDDLSIFRYPTPRGAYTSPLNRYRYRYDYNRASMLQRIAPLNIPWHPEKGDKEFTSKITFLGLSWDLDRRTVSLPDTKRLDFLDRVKSFINLCGRGLCRLNDVEQIHGSLCYTTFVYPNGRSYLPSLSNFAASFKDDESKTQRPSGTVIEDLLWWKNQLSQIGFYRLLIPRRQPAVDLDIYVDASTDWGIGVLIDGRWAAFQLSPTWKEPGKEITWLETLAVEFAIYFLEAMGHKGLSFIIHSDNTGAIGAVMNGRSANYEINYSIRRSYAVLSSLRLSPSFVFVPSQENKADALSRGELGLPKQRLLKKFRLPSELRSTFLPSPTFL